MPARGFLFIGFARMVGLGQRVIARDKQLVNRVGKSRHLRLVRARSQQVEDISVMEPGCFLDFFYLRDTRLDICVGVDGEGMVFFTAPGTTAVNHPPGPIFGHGFIAKDPIPFGLDFKRDTGHPRIRVSGILQ
jgi:hypothetical protein